MQELTVTDGIPNGYINNAQIINVVFENKNTAKSTGNTKDSWLTHPAFTFGSTELNGIWVGKFETTGSSDAPTVLPYTPTSPQISLKNQNISAQFLTSQRINYGLITKEASMLKNSEWGAVAYLSASNYGQGTTEVMINNSSLYYTGCAATVTPTKTIGWYSSQNDNSEGYYSGCENIWYTTNGKKASTTGTAYGVYDMVGGTWEYVMGVMEDSSNSNVPASGRNNSYNSGFTGRLLDSESDFTGETFPNSKYYDLYAYGTSNLEYTRGHLGDATVELGPFLNWKDPTDYTTNHNSWNKDYSNFILKVAPWLERGGSYNNGTSTGMFAFTNNDGRAQDYGTFRSVLR